MAQEFQLITFSVAYIMLHDDLIIIFGQMIPLHVEGFVIIPG